MERSRHPVKTEKICDALCAAAVGCTSPFASPPVDSLNAATIDELILPGREISKKKDSHS